MDPQFRIGSLAQSVEVLLALASIKIFWCDRCSRQVRWLFFIAALTGALQICRSSCAGDVSSLILIGCGCSIEIASLSFSSFSGGCASIRSLNFVAAVLLFIRSRVCDLLFVYIKSLLVSVLISRCILGDWAGSDFDWQYLLDLQICWYRLENFLTQLDYHHPLQLKGFRGVGPSCEVGLWDNPVGLIMHPPFFFSFSWSRS